MNEITDRAALEAQAAEYLDDTGESIDDIIEAFDEDDSGCPALDGCWVELDGYCPHGFPSWALYLGLV
jgi:hypothetical protein